MARRLTFRERAGEHGLSMIEALILIAVTAVVAMLILPLAPRASRDNTEIANRQIEAVNAQHAESSFRTALRNAIQPPITRRAGESVTVLSGNANALGLTIAGRTLTECAPAGGQGGVTLRIEQRGRGGALTCSGRTATNASLMSWQEGQASFAYSANGAAWQNAWTSTTTTGNDGAVASVAAPLVRFQLISARLGNIVWIERAGWTEPVDVDAAQDQAQDPTSTPPIDRGLTQ